ncbi:2-methylcitrate dehydratase PrpD [Apiospora aurea]|uniref:2-methylcitrate dehydratase PrpD n=1 Tax=Apiospora aurea TaxID=335848 RepID=A0ABR1Q8P6_9PEZI
MTAAESAGPGHVHSNTDTDPALDDNADTTTALCEWAIALKGSNVPKEVLERSQQCADAIFDYEPPGYGSVNGYPENTLRRGGDTNLLAAVQFLSTCNGRGKTQQKITGLDFLMAAFVGFKSGLTLGGPELFTRGWHSGVILGCPAAALAGSRLLGLSADRTESAVGIAYTQAGGLMSATYEDIIKRLLAGTLTEDRAAGSPGLSMAIGVYCEDLPHLGIRSASFWDVDFPMLLRSLPATDGGGYIVVGQCVTMDTCDGDAMLGPLPEGVRIAKIAAAQWEFGFVTQGTGEVSLLVPRLAEEGLLDADVESEKRSLRDNPGSLVAVSPDRLKMMARMRTGREMRWLGLV